VNEHVDQNLEPRYGRVLHYLVLAGFIILGLTFLIYAFGLLPSYMDAHRGPEVWHLPADEAVAETARPPFWGWATNLGRADLLSLGSLAILAATTPVGFLFLIVFFLRRRDLIYAGMALAQVIILVLAASGLVSGH
jgi:predicted membrane-bound dolichyl-phosphate-mannose-protein mannosyltransferase